MKIMIDEVEGEGIVSFFGKTVTILCMNYFYTGKLVGVNDECVKLEDAKIVYETGSYDSKEWKDAQKLPHDPWYVMKSSIESFGIMK